MTEKNKNIAPLDNFSERIKQKLEDHQMAVDSGSWGLLEKKLQPKRKKIILWWMISSAAIFALLFTLQPFGNEMNNEDQQELAYNEVLSKNQAPTAPRTTSTKNTFTHSTLTTDSKEEIKKTEKSRENKKHDSEKLKAGNRNKITSKIALNKTKQMEGLEKGLIEKEVASDPANTKKPAIPLIIEEQTKDSVLSTNKEKINELPSLVKPEIAEKKNPNRKNKTLLAVSYGSAGGSTLSTPNNMYFATTSNRFMLNASTNYNRMLMPEDFTTKHFMEPLSFGFTVRKEFTTYLGIETGIIYTYLSSTFEKSGSSNVDASLSLHYLGIPINIILPIWRKPMWEVYLSGGGMAEKGLRSIYVQNEYTGNQTITTDATTKIEGYQWSLNSAIGVSYKIQRNIGLYFEPKFSYFFDNNQPMSARTKKQTVIGLTAGIRFGL